MIQINFKRMMIKKIKMESKKEKEKVQLKSRF
jgi:hypothetical protein